MAAQWPGLYCRTVHHLPKRLALSFCPRRSQPEPCMQDASPVASLALLPERRALCGPITRRRLARLGLIYAVVFAAGLLLAYSVSDPHWQAFGLGLTVPGGGFFAYADTNTTQGLVHLGTALLAVGAFAFGLLLWFATGNVIAP